MAARATRRRVLHVTSVAVTADTAGLLLSVFLASAVEFVEALTIVLAMGVTRGWRSALAGVAAAVAALAVVTALAGYALASWLPESLMQLIVGTLLLIFGLQWLRKAVLRAAGLKAHNDEDETYREEVAAGRGAASERRLGVDWFGFVVSFKGVFLEGLEIVFIVITFGLNADDVPTAVAGAALAGVLVLGAGAIAHRPLARVPQNTIKFAVGLLLSTFGTFWAVEGLGVFAAGRGEPGVARRGRRAPGAAGHLVRVRVGRGPRAARWGRGRRGRPRRRGDGGGPLMRLVRGFGRFWYDFVVGDDWRIALGVVLVLAAGAVLVATGALADEVLAPLLGAAIVAVVSVSLVAGARR